MKIYSIRDRHTGFMTPMADTNDNTAIRNFHYALQQNNTFHTSPGDFDLYCVGEFDPDTGELTGSLPRVVATGIEVIKL